MTGLTGYFDMGGSYAEPTCKILTMAGFVSTDTKWEQLSAQWKAVLDAEDVSIFPHA